MDNYYNEVVDIAIKHAGREVLRDNANSAAVTEDVRFSADFDKRMKRMLSGYMRKKKALKIFKVSSKVAVILCLFVILSTAVIFSTEALRIEAMNLFVDHGDGYADLQFFKVDENNFPVGMVMPGYIPDRFKLEQAYKSESLYVSEYKDASGKVIKIQQGVYLKSLTVDDDGLGSYQTKIMDKAAYVAINKDINSIYFNSNAYGFSIYGDIDSSELIKIAESILEKDKNN